jgi:hypothetical protein
MFIINNTAFLVNGRLERRTAEPVAVINAHLEAPVNHLSFVSSKGIIRPMAKTNDLIKLIALGLLILALVVGCQKQDEPTPQMPRVQVIVDGQESRYETGLETVGDLLKNVGIELGELDRLEPAEFTPITDGMTIRVVRVRVEVESGPERVVPYERQSVQDTSVPAGQSRILEAGQNGLEQTIYRVVYEDGQEVERFPVRTITLQQAEPEVILVGAREAFTPTPLTGHIAYLSGSQDVGFNAWIMRGSSGAQRRLTSDGTLDTRVFALSPGGTHLLFSRREDDNALNSLWLIDTTVENAAPIDLRLTDILWAGWSPDGETIAYSTGEIAASAPGWQAHNDLWTAQLNNSLRLVRREQIVPGTAEGAYFWWGSSYAWSPDRRFIAYAQADRIGYVRLQDGKRTELHRFPPLRTYTWWVWVPQLSWSPDSRFLTGVIHGASLTDEPPEDSQVFDIWVFDIERPLMVKQVSEAGIWAAPVWSTAYSEGAGEGTNSRIAYGRARSPYESINSGYDLYVMDRDGSNRQRVFPTEEELGLKEPHVVWGPTGQQLVAIYQDDLFLIDLSQDRVRRLTIDASVQSVVWTQ